MIKVRIFVLLIALMTTAYCKFHEDDNGKTLNKKYIISLVASLALIALACFI